MLWCSFGFGSLQPQQGSVMGSFAKSHTEVSQGLPSQTLVGAGTCVAIGQGKLKAVTTLHNMLLGLKTRLYKYESAISS